MKTQTVPSNIVQLELKTQFQPPTIEACLLHGSKLGLPEIECQKFFHYYESNGWRVGRNRMKVWHGAMAGWKLRWQERAQGSQISKSMQTMLWAEELKRIEVKMISIKGSYSEHQGWDEKDKNLYRVLRARRDELLKLLGMVI